MKIRHCFFRSFLGSEEIKTKIRHCPVFSCLNSWADKWWQGWQAPRRWRCRWWWGGRRWWRCWRRTSARSPPVCSQRSQAGCGTQSWWGVQGETGWNEAGILLISGTSSRGIQHAGCSLFPFSRTRCFATDHCQHVVRQCPLACRWRNVHVTVTLSHNLLCVDAINARLDSVAAAD